MRAVRRYEKNKKKEPVRTPSDPAGQSLLKDGETAQFQETHSAERFAFLLKGEPMPAVSNFPIPGAALQEVLRGGVSPHRGRVRWGADACRLYTTAPSS